MKIIVIGGTGLIGTKVVNRLSARRHQAIGASPKTGVNTVTGEGLAAALKDAEVIVDVSNSPSFEDQAVMDFFTTSTANLLKYGAAAGVRHLVALSVVGSDRLSESAYIRGKLAQENLIKQGVLPHTILHATQFFEFWKAIADLGTQQGKVHLAPVFVQPVASDEVAEALDQISSNAPLNGVVEFAGPERFRLDNFIQRGLQAIGDDREIVSDPDARYFGARLTDDMLVPAAGARLGHLRFDDWLGQNTHTEQAK
jgi:uncharacterized protein YbjT (DUF2867 family)